MKFKKFRPGGLFKSGLKMRPNVYLPPRFKNKMIDVPTASGVEINIMAIIKNLFKKGESNA